jgi:hypothetical protein
LNFTATSSSYVNLEHVSPGKLRANLKKKKIQIEVINVEGIYSLIDIKFNSIFFLTCFNIFIIMRDCSAFRDPTGKAIQ